MAWLQLLDLNPIHTRAHTIDRFHSGMGEEFSEKTGQIILQAQGIARQVHWLADYFHVIGHFLACYPSIFLHFFLLKSAKSFLFPSFGSSAKYPIIDQLQSQNTFALHSVRCLILQELDLSKRWAQEWVMVMGLTLVQRVKALLDSLGSRGQKGCLFLEVLYLDPCLALYPCAPLGLVAWALWWAWE